MSRSLDDLMPVVADRAREFLKRCQAAGLSVIITSTLRTYPEQDILYAQGRRHAGKIVTNAKPGFSWHNHGCAFDVAFKLPDGSITWDGAWALVGELGRSVSLAWGGDFKSFSDKPHFEYSNGLTLASLRATHDKGVV